MAQEHIWVWGGVKWKEETCLIEDDKKMGYVRFHDIKYFYANIIDYARVAMCLLAAFTIPAGYPFLTALLIFGSTLLDWVDGPVARRYNQCTIFGSGVDWLADVLCQVITLAWWTQLDVTVLPWVMLLTTIETTCCVFDYAMTTTLRYPRYTNRGGFFLILDWSMPNNSYTHLGTFLWLAYPIFSMACCLDCSWPERSVITHILLKACEWLFFIPSLMYGWCELAYFVHIMDHWREPRQDVTKED